MSQAAKREQATTTATKQIATNAAKLISKIPPGRLRAQVLNVLAEDVKEDDAATIFQVGKKTISHPKKAGGTLLVCHQR